MKIIAIDPRRTELARSADLHLQVRPGEDPTLLAGMVRVILEEGLLRPASSSRAHVDGVDALRAAVADYTPDYVEARTGVAGARMIGGRAALRRRAARHGDDVHRRQHGAAPRRDAAPGASR